ncbi:MAG: SDR family oxidoreductase [Bacillota bacterium]|nr:SDR family oxidoreductase [Bacillota bacterium]
MNKGDIVLITGGSAGMGKAAAVLLAKHGAHVVILCRNKERGEKALEDIRKETGSSEVDMMLCNLGSLESIRGFAEEFKRKYGRLNVLVNNAGVIIPGRHETVDGFELQFGVNHLGHFLLTNLLLDALKAGAPSRIVVVASGAHKQGKIHLDDLNLTGNYNLVRAYCQSKLANVLFTYELAERLKGYGITANCLHPGAVATQMGINRSTGFGTFITRLLKPFFLTPEQGAATSVYLAASEEVQGVSGKYFAKCRAIQSSRLSYDKELAKRLWNISEKMTGFYSVKQF